MSCLVCVNVFLASPVRLLDVGHIWHVRGLSWVIYRGQVGFYIMSQDNRDQYVKLEVSSSRSYNTGHGNSIKIANLIQIDWLPLTLKQQIS